MFSVPVTGGPVTTLAAFSNANGFGPLTSLTLSGGTLYGTTAFSGSGTHGTVFSIPVGGGPITDIASFTGLNGENPYGRLTLGPDGTLYGTTDGGGTIGYGRSFR